MPYYMIEDFKHGMDSRKSHITGLPGTLFRLKNAHITPGGEIEKRKAWVPWTVLPPTSVGLHSIGSKLYIFGKDDLAAEAIPANTVYQRLQHPGPEVLTGGPALLEIIRQVETFSGAPYVVAEFEDGLVAHYYDGAIVSDIMTIGAELSTFESVTQRLAETIRLRSPELTVSATGSSLTVIGADGGDGLFMSGGISSDGATTMNMTVQELQFGSDPGIVSIYRFVLGGTFDPNVSIYLDWFAFATPDGSESEGFIRVRTGTAGVPRAIKVFDDKVYAVTGSFLYFSGYSGTDLETDLGFPDCTKWRTAGATPLGAGWINLATQSGGAQNLVGLGLYQKQLAVFSESEVQIWAVGPDPDGNARTQLLDNTGAVDQQSILSYGNADLFYLARDGIRSIRARDSSNVAGTQDVGSPINRDVQEAMRVRTLALSWTPHRAVFMAQAFIVPDTGQIMFDFDRKAFIFSNFPGAKITAWSEHEPEGAFVLTTAIVAQGNRVYARVQEVTEHWIAVLGGPRGDVYDDVAEVEAWLPFLSFDSPSTQKTLLSLDVACDGTWAVYLHPDPRDPWMYELLGVLDGTTYGFQPQFPVAGESTHFSLRFVHQGPGYARLANVAIHYQSNEAD